MTGALGDGTSVPSASNESPWVLVTGVTRGIGRATALELAARGWNVTGAYLRSDDAAAAVSAQVRDLGRAAVFHRVNLAKPEGCDTLIARLDASGLRLHGLVHAAGLGALSPALDRRPGRWRLAWQTHFAAFLELVQLSRRLFEPGSSIVALTSLGAHRVMPGYAPVAVAKAALEAAVRYLAAELSHCDITVNAVCGGPVDTDSLRSFGVRDALEAESRRRPPGRVGRPEDLAPVVAFLLSRDARWIRGQVITADGGFGLH